MPSNLLDLSLDQLTEQCKELGQPPFRARQIFDWVYQKYQLDPGRMNNLPAGFLKDLSRVLEWSPAEITARTGEPSEAQKFLLRLNDGQQVESVLIPGPGRLTACLSSQAGCKFACRFCASGIGGWQRDLTAGEILAQLILLQQAEQRISHVVMMGTGEPLDNLGHVLPALERINDPAALNIAARRITVSTCGIVPGIRRLAEFGRQIELAVSLHAPDNTLRDRLIPVNKKYPLEKLLAACREYVQKTRRQITFEYIVIPGVTDTPDAVVKLAALLKGLLCKVNIIPYNPVAEFNWKMPSRNDVYRFRDALAEQKITSTIRWSKGTGANGACGQLRGSVGPSQMGANDD
ncbi:MAG: 23S rRNA (adenine(2503)-C(2))-methyltransferase RlmN [Candidatus Omnitrophota bacterium]